MRKLLDNVGKFLSPHHTRINEIEKRVAEIEQKVVRHEAILAATNQVADGLGGKDK